MPYGPFVEALQHWVAHATEEQLQAHVADHGAELARLVPNLEQRVGSLPPPQSSDPETARYLLFSSVVGLLDQATRIRPVTIVLEDLQWADPPSLQMLRHLVASSDPMHLLIVATYRDAELSGSHPLTETLVALRREPGVEHLPLSGLDEGDVHAFMVAVTGRSLDEAGEELALAVHRETDGNPFFVGEVLRELAETGVISQGGTGGWTSGAVRTLPLPDSVRHVVASRVARLGQPAGHVLPTAAVIGREFDLDVLGLATDRTEDELLEILDGAAAANLVAEIADSAGRYSFSHALVQHTLVEDLGGVRRARAHRRVAEALEGLSGAHPGDRLGELAYHWSHTTRADDVEKAISYNAQAAHASLEALAPGAAVLHFEQALDFLVRQADPDPLTHVDLLFGLGRAQRQAGVASFRETLLEASQLAQLLGATDRMIAAALENNRGFFSASGEIDREKVDVLTAALDATPEGRPADQALLLATLASELSFGRPEERHALATSAERLARQLGDAATLVRVLTLIEMPLQPAALDERLANTEEALHLAQELGDPSLVFWAAAHGHVDAGQACDFERSFGCLDMMRSLSNRLKQPTMEWATAFCDAAHALLVGHHEDAEQLANIALDIGTRSGQPDALAIYGSQILWARFQQGRMNELVPLVEQLTVENPGAPAFRGFLALTYLESGMPEEAARLLDSEAADRFGSLSQDLLWTTGIADYAQVAVELQARGPAGLFLEQLVPYRTQFPFIGASALDPFAFYLGGLAAVLGRYEEAETYFREATEINGRAGRMFCQAHTDLVWGRMLARRGAQPGDLDASPGDCVQRAHAIAAAQGYGGIERKACARAVPVLLIVPSVNGGGGMSAALRPRSRSKKKKKKKKKKNPHRTPVGPMLDRGSGHWWRCDVSRRGRPG